MLAIMPAAVLTFYLIVLATGYWLRFLNLTYLKAHRRTVPAEFQGALDSAQLEKISDYTLANSRVGIVESILGNLITMIFLFAGLLGIYDKWVLSFTDSLLWGGLLFALLLLYAETLIDIPFSIFRNFKIENRYGFNTMTVRLWFTDLIKTISISSILSSVVVLSVLAIIQASPSWWWFWVWIFLLFLSIFIMYISPYVIEPLFFKFEPVRSEGLENKVRGLMKRAGIDVSRVFQVDASRRSRHSNAYFTGLGRVKRIVLFDTLIEQMTQDEVIAVLAHEIGHWKKRHILKRIILTEFMSFGGLFLAFHLLNWTGLPGIVGLETASLFARVVILGFLSTLVMFPLTPLFAFLSRRDEREADRYAAELIGSPDTMASALVKLSRENLANLHPHPLYAKFHYSHPPIVERIRDLKSEPGSR
jgi:STE24 endopeptidase